MAYTGSGWAWIWKLGANRLDILSNGCPLLIVQIMFTWGMYFCKLTQILWLLLSPPQNGGEVKSTTIIHNGKNCHWHITRKSLWFKQWLSKYESWNSSSINRELVRNADSQLHSRPTALETLGRTQQFVFQQTLKVILMDVEVWEPLE